MDAVDTDMDIVQPIFLSVYKYKAYWKKLSGRQHLPQDFVGRQVVKVDYLL
jgi:hypothetical protein